MRSLRFAPKTLSLCDVIKSIPNPSESNKTGQHRTWDIGQDDVHWIWIVILLGTDQSGDGQHGAVVYKSTTFMNTHHVHQET